MKINKIVVKIGTSTIANATDGLPNISRMEAIVQVLSDIKKLGVQVVVVSSGAIGIGAGKLGFLNKTKTVVQKQACASVGQCALMNMYDRLFTKFGFVVSQILLTQQVLDGADNELNAKNTFNVLFDAGVVPIVNANDTVSTAELEFGDNDALSAAVASLVDADLLIILTDLDGIFDSNPKTNKNAKLIEHIYEIDDHLREVVKGKPNELGTGGMETKLKAAEFLSLTKTPTVILNGKNPDRIKKVLVGEVEGTLIDVSRVFLK